MGSNQTAGSRRVTVSGVLGSTVFEKGNEYNCLSFCSMGSLFKQEQDFTIFYRICAGVSWVQNQPGDETDRLDRKGYHGGCGGRLSIWQGKVQMWSYFDPLELLIETGAGHKYPLSIM